MITFDQASALVHSVAQPVGTETLPIELAHGRTLARAVIAAIDSPRRSVSAMDGYAVRETDLGSFPARLRLVGESFAGQSELPQIEQGECARIFTGGAIPAGADRVVVQEIVQRELEWALFEQAFGSATHIRKRASDFKAGDLLLPVGSRLGPRSLVTAAGADLDIVEVYRQPRFAILGTGDELVLAGQAREHPARIPESLSVGIAALGEIWGGSCIARLFEADDPARLRRAATKALDTADLLVVTGGASVGERDYAKSIFESGLDLVFSKVAMKPGKPVWLGHSRGRLILGLPGNPTSAMVTARLFLAPLIAGLVGRDPNLALKWRPAKLLTSLSATGERETFVRARWSGDMVEVLADQDSSAQRALAAADLLVRRPALAPASPSGETVDILDF